MIYEYAVEPEIASQWGSREHYRFFVRELGLGQGRLISRYPKKWTKKVWECYSGSNDMEKKRLEDILSRLKDNMIKRKDMAWREGCSWQENVLIEHKRYPFWGVLIKDYSKKLPGLFDEDDLSVMPCTIWDIPHGKPVKRVADEMASELGVLLTHCRWIKFVDPYLSCLNRYKKSMQKFFSVLGASRPVEHPERIEIHTSKRYDPNDKLKLFYEKILPAGMKAYLYQWQQRPDGQSLHNRFILTDIGGVSFYHGLDIGKDGETDDISRLDFDQYIFRCSQYNPQAPAFDPAEETLELIGRKKG
jgi:hypothetical protein